ncbi:MAG: TonB-dependent receptor [Bacteroidia bacterium]|nr:TonB-dependent receptor [Bacteroidia bacterium]
MKTRLHSLLLLLLWSSSGLWAQNFTISGHVQDAESGEALLGSAVMVLPGKKGVYTNNYGFFSLTLPKGKYQLLSSFIGYETDTQTVILDQNRPLEIKLKAVGTQVEEVVISAAKEAYANEVKSPQMSSINLQMKNLKLVPTIGGEVDIMKVIQLLPGVTKGGEGTTSILVRGGDPDQNLILLDEAVVYNVSHLFGFFSVFNPDALKDLTIIKGGFPGQYGGRLSSVLDINMNEGNLKSYHVKGGIGLLSSRLTVEGPIVKEKASFSLSGRRTYIDQVLGLINVPVPYYFYDVNAKANVKLGDKDRIFWSAYLGDDVLYTPDLEDQGDPNDTSGVGDLNAGFGFRLGNLTSTLRWNHLFSERLFSNTSLIFNRFKYDITGNVLNNSIFIGSSVLDLSLKSDFGFYRNPEQTIRFGGQYIRHRFRPNVISAQGDISQIIENSEVNNIFADEIAIYGQYDWQMTENLKIAGGLRISGAVVPKRVYASPEPRFSAVYTLDDKNSFKAGYALMRQYLHLVSSSTVALPTDLWYPVTADVKPQTAHQVAASYTHHFEKINSLLTVESYYKWMYNLTEYREGANLILNNNFESELLQGDGRSYGFELLLKRDEGRINGWIGYTLSFSQRFFEELNEGKPFWAKYDRRHDLSVVTIWKATDQISISAVYTYLSGARFTPQVGQYLTPNPSLTGVETIPIFAERNSTRLTAANRVDLNLVFANKPRKKFRSEWHFSCYNLLNSPTPIRVNLTFDPERGYVYEQPSFLGRLPSIAWNFEF